MDFEVEREQKGCGTVAGVFGLDYAVKVILDYN